MSDGQWLLWYKGKNCKNGFLGGIRTSSFNLTEKRVFMVPDGNVLVLSGVGDDFNQATDLRFGIQGHAEQF